MNTTSSISVSGISVHIDRKDIKNLHVGVYPPHGRVRVAAPIKIDDEAVRLAVINRLSWIKRQVQHFEEQQRETQREMISGESHYFFGKRYLLEVIYGSVKHEVVLRHSIIELHVRTGTTVENRQKLLYVWYRENLKIEVAKFISKYEKVMNLKVPKWEIKKMKTKWGSCHIENQNILFNLNLARVPLECIEYIVVHEMVHFLERRHNEIFKSYLDRFMPHWQQCRDILNQSSLGYEE